MTMNFEKGKTEGVFMFHGPGANQHRTATFDTTNQPCVIVSTPSHILRLRIGASYKHLGVRYSMDADLDLEIDTKLAAARQAFEEVPRPVFLNKAIPVEARLKLYHSLVLSRLL